MTPYTKTHYCTDFRSTSTSDRTTGYMVHLIKEAREIQVNMENNGRNSGLTLSLTSYPVTNMFVHQDARQSTSTTSLRPPAPTGSQLLAKCSGRYIYMTRIDILLIQFLASKNGDGSQNIGPLAVQPPDTFY
jgi:hypothetical protein